MPVEMYQDKKAGLKNRYNTPVKYQLVTNSMYEFLNPAQVYYQSELHNF